MTPSGAPRRDLSGLLGLDGQDEVLSMVLLNARPGHVVALDSSGTIVAVDDSWRLYSGHPMPGDAADVGTNYLSRCDSFRELDATDAQQIHDGLAAVLAGTSVRFSHAYPGVAAWRDRWFELIAVPIGAQPDPRILVVHREITDLVARSRAHARLLAVEARQQQAQRLDAMGRLAGGIAHEFNNLLTAMIGFTELALRRPTLPPEVHADLLEVARAAQSAASVTSQLQAFSRGQVLRPRPLSLNDIVHCVEPLARRLMGADVSVTVDLATPLPLVHADPAQLEHVLLTLLANAAGLMPDGGRVVVQTRPVDGDGTLASVEGTHPRPHVMLSVADESPGMDEDACAHVFEPFYATGAYVKGHGLRLATVYGVVKQSGGAIDVTSRPGDGTTFRVYLPVWDGPHR